jgi:hypothetical protein
VTLSCDKAATPLQEMNIVATSPLYQLRITLNGTKPPIWRRVAVPPEITLGQLHEVIQIAMGWTDSHLHHFVLRDKSLKPSKDEMAQAMRSMLEGDDDAADAVFSRVRGERYFVPKQTPFGDPTELDGQDEDAVTLAEVCPKVKSKLIYEYDFGDGWQHTVEVQKIVEPEPGVEYPVCLAGKKACPPEDCGGVWGYYDLLETVANPKHENHDDMLEWLGDDFDPEAFDLGEVNAILAQWRNG